MPFIDWQFLVVTLAALLSAAALLLSPLLSRRGRNVCRHCPHAAKRNCPAQTQLICTQKQ